MRLSFQTNPLSTTMTSRRRQRSYFPIICFSATTIAVTVTLLSLSAVPVYASASHTGGYRMPWSKSSAAQQTSHHVTTKSPFSSWTPRGGAAAGASKKKPSPTIKGAVASNDLAPKKGMKTKKMMKKKKMVKKVVKNYDGVPILPEEQSHNKATKSVISGVGSISAGSTAAAAKSSSGPVRDKMPSIFRMPSEEKYDRYAAALAVTEGLRRVRDAEIDRALQDKKTSATTTNSDFNHGTGGEISNDNNSYQVKTPQQLLQERKQRAESAFLLQTTKAVKALGMTVTQFNQIGREVLSDPALKERVSEQAYLYRMASAINLERVPLLEDPTSKKLLQSHRRHRVQMFARSITEIEDLRADEMEALRQSLHVDRFPPGFDLSDPNVQPLLHPEVRSVCEAFPLKAEEIVKRYGLESDEFNKMLEETKRNPIFGWRVKKYVEKVEEERAKEKKPVGVSKN
mmetsp:Transcript_16473/g.34448  ORF Transcript_16473/g.34448 Transcript_16473/m.34448 type:complete len:457 (-) Transcript_16473:131-1501(-)